jgi:hypothetical protein
VGFARNTAHALRALAVLGFLTRKTGRCAAPGKINDIRRKPGEKSQF